MFSSLSYRLLPPPRPPSHHPCTAMKERSVYGVSRPPPRHRAGGKTSRTRCLATGPLRAPAAHPHNMVASFRWQPKPNAPKSAQAIVPKVLPVHAPTTLHAPRSRQQPPDHDLPSSPGHSMHAQALELLQLITRAHACSELPRPCPTGGHQSLARPGIACCPRPCRFAPIPSLPAPSAILVAAPVPHGHAANGLAACALT